MTKQPEPLRDVVQRNIDAFICYSTNHCEEVLRRVEMLARCHINNFKT
jgi:hypothetical protein